MGGWGPVEGEPKGVGVLREMELVALVTRYGIAGYVP